MSSKDPERYERELEFNYKLHEKGMHSYPSCSAAELMDLRAKAIKDTNRLLELENAIRNVFKDYRPEHMDKMGAFNSGSVLVAALEGSSTPKVVSREDYDKVMRVLEKVGSNIPIGPEMEDWQMLVFDTFKQQVKKNGGEQFSVEAAREDVPEYVRLDHVRKVVESLGEVDSILDNLWPLVASKLEKK